MPRFFCTLSTSNSGHEGLLMPTPVASYMIRRKVLKLLGAAFYVTDDSGEQIGFCNQKAFRLHEDIRLYTDQTKSEEVLSIRARSVIDFGATYDVHDDNGILLGSARRKGLKSIVRDEWHIFDADGREVARLKEDSGNLAMLRRVLPAIEFLAPQKYNLVTPSGDLAARFETQRNPFLYKLHATAYDTPGLDPQIVMALGFLLAAIEGRQNKG